MSDPNQPEQVLAITADQTATFIRSLYHEDENPPLEGFHEAFNGHLMWLAASAKFVPRAPAESDPTLKQLIVYAIVEHDGKTLCYTRGKVGEEVRLHAKRSIGVGGHINPGDVDLADPGVKVFQDAVTRELTEELGLLQAHIKGATLIGVVNENASPVGQVHLGLVYHVQLHGTHGVAFEETMVNPVWLSDDELVAVEDLEPWSHIIRGYLRPAQPDTDMPGWQTLVINEKAQLDEKLVVLTTFLGTPAFDALRVEERERLTRQHNHMTEYSKVLGERIQAF